MTALCRLFQATPVDDMVDTLDSRNLVYVKVSRKTLLSAARCCDIQSLPVKRAPVNRQHLYLTLYKCRIE